jgi:hypothetical protein
MDPLAQYNQTPSAPQQPAAPLSPMTPQQPAYAPPAPVHHGGDVNPTTHQAAPEHGVLSDHQRPEQLPSMEAVTALHKPWTAIFGVILLIITIVGSFVLYALNVQAAAKTEEAQNRSKELSDKIGAEPLKTVEKQAKAVQAALTGYRTARGEQLDLGLLNQQVRDLMPKNVVVDSLTIDDKAGFRVAVQSDTFIDSGKLLISFREAPMFSTAELETASLDKQEGQKATTAVVIGTLNQSYLQQAATSEIES